MKLIVPVLLGCVLSTVVLASECLAPIPEATFSNLAKILAPTSELDEKGWLQGSDSLDPSSSVYTYYMRPCFDPADNSDKPTPTCAKDANAASYQTYKSSDGASHCKNLGTKLADTYPKQTSLYRDVGIQFKYIDGEACSTGTRSSVANLICSPKTETSLVYTNVTETSHCEYTFTTKSFYACPDECYPSDQDFSICSGHGICQYDANDDGKARCFCNEGFVGDSCNKSAPSASSSSSTTTLIVFIILLLIALIGVSGLLYTKIKKLRQDADYQYADLGAQPQL